MSKRMRIAAAVAAAATIIAAAPAMAAPKTINVSTPMTPMKDMFKFKGMPATLTAGTYVFAYTNTSGIDHNLKVGTVSTPTFKSGTKTIKVTLKKGTVKYICAVPGHAQAGMKGTITVK